MKLLIANKLTELRKGAGLSQEEVADKLVVSRQAVSGWERGEATPDTTNLIALSKLYDVTLDELVYGDKTAPSEAPKERKGSLARLRDKWNTLSDKTKKRCKGGIIGGTIGALLVVLAVVLSVTLTDKYTVLTVSKLSLGSDIRDAFELLGEPSFESDTVSTGYKTYTWVPKRDEEYYRQLEQAQTAYKAERTPETGKAYWDLYSAAKKHAKLIRISAEDGKITSVYLRKRYIERPRLLSLKLSSYALCSNGQNREVEYTCNSDRDWRKGRQYFDVTGIDYSLVDSKQTGYFYDNDCVAKLTFVVKKPNVTVQTPFGANVRIDGENYYEVGETVTLYAYTEQEFRGWYRDGLLVSSDTSYTFVMPDKPVFVRAEVSTKEEE